MIKSGSIRVSGQIVTSCSHQIIGEIIIEIDGYTPEIEENIRPQDIPLNIVYEDEDIIVIDKPSGLVVHPGAGQADGTLVNGLKFYSENNSKCLSDINGGTRPGIVHRLDKDTSGLMLIAKTNQAHAGLARQFEERAITKKYIAFCCRVPRVIEQTIRTGFGRDVRNRLKMSVKPSGKEAVTHYKVMTSFANVASKIECILMTGRTHQIRVHMQHIKTPIIGDKTYNMYSDTTSELFRTFPRQALHSHYIRFLHPLTGTEMEFHSDLPNDMAELEAALAAAHRVLVH